MKNIRRASLIAALITAAVVFVGIGSVFTLAKPQANLTLEQAAKLKFRVSVKHAPFDIPVNYSYTDYSYLKKWPHPSQGEINGTERREVDYIKVIALLPDMSPYTSENAAEFEAPGWGKKVKVLFGHKRHFHWDSYIKSRPEQIKSSELPNMLEYWGLTKSTTVFVSSDHMVKIECSMPKAVLYPSCTVMRPYKYKTETGATIHPEFFITYHFSRDYIQQWHGIDKKVEVLIDQFAASAQN